MFRPKPPHWALNAGLPSPKADEDFTTYVIRLGLDPDLLLVDLTQQTLELANIRLETAIKMVMPDVFWDYAKARKKAAVYHG